MRRHLNNTSSGVRREYERYLALAGEAALSGGIIETENCYQHAEIIVRASVSTGRRAGSPDSVAGRSANGLSPVASRDCGAAGNLTPLSCRTSLRPSAAPRLALIWYTERTSKAARLCCISRENSSERFFWALPHGRGVGLSRSTTQPRLEQGRLVTTCL